MSARDKKKRVDLVGLVEQGILAPSDYEHFSRAARFKAPHMGSKYDIRESNSMLSDAMKRKAPLKEAGTRNTPRTSADGSLKPLPEKAAPLKKTQREESDSEVSSLIWPDDRSDDFLYSPQPAALPRVPAFKGVEPVELRGEVLKRMYETSEWSDLSVVTSTKTFHVHKSVVCPASPFFHAACTRGFLETKSGVVTVDEDEHTMDAILRYFYELPIMWLNKSIDDAMTRDWLLKTIALRKATDKYDIPTLAHRAERSFWRQYGGKMSIKDIIEIGALAIDEEMPFNQETRSWVGSFTHSRIEEIRKDKQLWDTLYENKEYMELVLDASTMALQTAKKRKLDE